MNPLSRASRIPGRLRRASRAEIHAAWRRAPIRSNVVLYESFSGNGMLCNPEAIFRYLLDHPDFAHLHHVWAMNGAGPCVAAASTRSTRGCASSNTGHRLLPAPGHRGIPGQQRDLPAGVQQAPGPGLREHLARDTR